MIVRAITVDGDAVHHTPLAMVIVDRIVLDAAVVPKGDCGFTMNSAEQAAAWYQAGVANGTSIKDSPSMRLGLLDRSISPTFEIVTATSWSVFIVHRPE